MNTSFVRLSALAALLAGFSLPVGAQGISSTPAPLPKPIGRWGLDAIEAGGKLKSAIGGPSGKVSGTKLKVGDGKVGKALVFSPTGTVVSLPTSLTRKRATAMTFALWICPEKKEIEGYGPVIDCNGRGGLSISVQGDFLNVNFAGEWHGERFSPKPMKIQFSRWVYLVASYDGAVARVYLDGEKVYEFAKSYAPNFGDEAILGRGKYGAIDNVELGKEDRMIQFEGRMDDVQIFDEALTPEQVKPLYYQAKSAKPASGGLGLLP